MKEIIEKAVKAAKKNYREALKEIILSRILIKRLIGLIPEGWEIKINSFFGVEISKGYKDPGTDVIEFKTVVKMVESVIGQKLALSASISGKEVNLLRAEAYVSLRKRFRFGESIGVKVFLWNPKSNPDCEISFKRTWSTVPVISDKCLGIKEVY